MKKILIRKTSLVMSIMILVTAFGVNFFKEDFQTMFIASETLESLLVATSSSINQEAFTPTKFSYQVALSPTFDNWADISNSDRVGNMSFDNDGNLWVTSRFTIVRWDLEKNQYEPYILGGCPGEYVSSILSESPSSIWVSSSNGLWHFDGTSWEQIFPSENFGTLELSSDGGIWAVVRGNKLYKFDGVNWNKYESVFPENEDILVSNFRSMVVDQNDLVWVVPNKLISVGSENLGVWNFDKNSWMQMLPFSNKRDNFIYLAQDSLARIWLIEGNNPFVGYKGSIHLLNSPKDISFPFDIIPPRLSIADDKNGNLWIASVSELYKFDGASLSKYSLPKIESSILSIAVSREDKICIGTEGEGVWCKEKDEWRNYQVGKVACP